MFGADPRAFMGSMFAYMDSVQKKQKRIQYGIENKDGFDGVPWKNIPFEFGEIIFCDGFYDCINRDYRSFYKEDGTLVHSAAKIQNLGRGVFILFEKDSSYGCIYKWGEKKSEALFHERGFGGQFSEKSNFIQVCCKDTRNVVIDDNGEVVLENDNYNSIYIDHNIAFQSGKVYNLLTGDLIVECHRGNPDEISTDDWCFLKVDENCVYKIDKITGVYEVFGQPEKKPEPVAVKPPESKEEPKPRQQRNDICECGSGKKYKNCCGKNQ